MRIWAAATDTRNGTEIAIFKTKIEMEDWLLDQIGGDRDAWELSGIEGLDDYLHKVVENVDTWTWTYEDFEP